MNANELTFGIEIETLVPASGIAGLVVGNYHRGIQVPYLPEGWKAERDGSVHGLPGEQSCEIVSPVLKGENGIAQVIAVLAVLEAKGHRVNKTCGIHVHIGWCSFWSVQVLARLITIVAYLEKGLYAVTGTKARELGTYCGGIRKYGNDKDAKHNLDRNRYHALNLVNLGNGKNTVEFRVFSGSLNPVKVVGWIQIALGLVQRAVESKRSPKWTPAPLKGGWKKAGEGQSECERLMGYLAWGNGYAAAHGGRSYGTVESRVTLDAVRAEMRRLAKKYDAQV